VVFEYRLTNLRSNFMRLRYPVFAITSALLLAGCALGLVLPQVDHIESFSALDGNQAVVVGRIELHPPLAKHEQDLSGTPLLNRNPRNTVTLAVSQHWAPGDKQSSHESDRRLDAALDQTFFVRMPARTFYVLFGDLPLEVRESAELPGDLRATLRSGDKAVYIGTIRYHRDEFFTISRVQIVDDYGRANAEFKKKFGSKYSLRKTLLTAVK
jgi:hypothetical protein